MNKHLRLTKLKGGYEVHYSNGVLIGDFLYSEDGYLNWWPSENKGYLPAYLLREIADTLDELNNEWDVDVKQALKELDPEYIKLVDDKFWALIDE